MKIVDPSWGNLIKYYRQMQKLKQDDVAFGICTPSYLSRIENGVVVADYTLYEQLFNKLGIDLNLQTDEEKQNVHFIEELYEKLLSNEPLIAQEVEQLQLIQQTMRTVENQLRCKLIYCRYLLSIKLDDEARNLLNELEPFIPYKNDRLTELYIAISAYAHLSFFEFQQLADREQLNTYAQLLFHAPRFEQANYHYHLAFAFHRSYQLHKALHHIELASQYTTHLYKPLFQLKLYSMKGVIYNDLHRFQEALIEYEAGLNLLQHVPSIQDPMQFSSLHNNIAYCYECQKDFQQANKHYALAQQYAHDLHSVINWMRTCYQQPDLQQLKILFQTYEKSLFSVEHHIYQYELLLYAYENEHTIQGLKALEDKAFPHFEQQQYYALTLFYAPLWGNFYEQLHAYKHASKCYQLALHASEKIRERMNS